MPVKIDTSGLDKFKRNLKKVSGEHKVTDKDLFPDSFIRKYSDYSTFQEFCKESGIKDSSEIGNGAFSEFVAKHSRFDNWSEMMKTAQVEYIKRTLNS